MSDLYKIEADKEELEFDQELAKNRFNEIKGLFLKVIDALKSDNSNNKAIANAIEKNGLSIGEFVNELRKIEFKIPEIKVPNVTVNSNQKELLDASNLIVENQNETNKLLQNLIDKKTDYKIKVTHWNLAGRIDEVTIKAI